MSQQEKLIAKIRSNPKDFTWEELERLLGGLGYEQRNGSGSRRKFVHVESGVFVSLHEPHPRSVLKSYQIRDVLHHLKQEGRI